MPETLRNLPLQSNSTFNFYRAAWNSDAV